MAGLFFAVQSSSQTMPTFNPALQTVRGAIDEMGAAGLEPAVAQEILQFLKTALTVML
jgi:hypothetical protein